MMKKNNKFENVLVFLGLRKYSRDNEHKINKNSTAVKHEEKRLEFPKRTEIYKQSVDIACKKKYDITLDNNNHEHAEYALAKIFETAKGELYIFADSLSKPGNAKRSKFYLRNLHQFVSNSSNKLSVILLKDDPNSETLTYLKAMKSHDDYKENINLSIFNEKHKDQLLKTIKGGNDFHFTTASTSGIYRLEYDTINRKATLNFNDPNYAESLKKLFKKYSTFSDTLEIEGEVKIPHDIAEIMNSEVESEQLIPESLVQVEMA